MSLHAEPPRPPFVTVLGHIGFGIKALVIGGALLFASVQTLQSWGEAVILTSAVLGSLGWLWHHVVQPTRRGIKDMGEMADHLRQLPEFRDDFNALRDDFNAFRDDFNEHRGGTNARLEVIEGALYATGNGDLPIRRRNDPPH